MSSSATSFATTTFPSKPLPLPHRRRDKAQLSCTLCRKRKLKCDRSHPCDTCVKRGLSLSCTYVHSSKSLTSSEQCQPRPPAYLKLQERIGQLENLVASQLKSTHGGEYLTSLSNSNTDQERLSQVPSSGKGRISIKDAETTWVESDHWTAILDGINELKDSLEDIPGTIRDNNSDVSDSVGPELLLGEQKQAKVQEILAAIPPRPTADRLVSQFVKIVDLAPMILHMPTFLKEYEYFWDHREQTSMLWIGLLFAIMCIAVLHQQSSLEPSNLVRTTQDGASNRRLAQLYRTKSAQCLVLGNYTKPSRYAIEALLLYMHVEYSQSKDTQTGLWILLGITIRLALRMGYHRDGSDFSQISPFHTEMRRRVWCVLFMLDAAAAAQFGLPRMVQVPQSNTAEPRNLFDEDIQEEMLEIPSARPESVSTPVQYFVAKNRIISLSGKITDLKTLTESPDYAEVLKLDVALQSVYDSIPRSLAMRPMTKTIMDSPTIIMQRIYIALVFFKAKCILHRTYLISSWTNQCYMYSRSACIEAALQIVQIQQILDQETQLGGRLYDDRGKVTASMTSDFLLATTILCADINHAINKGLATISHVGKPDVEPNEKVMAVLRSVHPIWLRSCDSSQDAQQAARAIEIVLAKTRRTTNTLSSSSSAIWEGSTTMDTSSFNIDLDPTFDTTPITSNPVLFGGQQGSEFAGFPDFSLLDLDMGYLGEFDLPTTTKM